MTATAPGGGRIGYALSREPAERAVLHPRRRQALEEGPGLAGYRPPPGGFDELLDEEGRVRPVWRPFVEGFSGLSEESLKRRTARGEQYLHDAGVFFRRHGAAGGGGRTWPFSPVPLILHERDWRRLADGLVQRAGLLEAVAADLYGENRLVAEGLLPAEPVAASPAWLRPLVGVRPASGHWLHFLAFDVARRPDGRWRVLRDRTDSPAGAGTALETRLATQRVFQDLFREAHAHRLAGFFRAFRDAMGALDRVGGGRVGMLTAGPGGANYFEHAYLARYLGFMLFEGEDIAVENGVATVRTVAGPRPLGVLWRRLRAGRADPLELDETSGAGVPGLVSAIRDGALAAVNALGAGVLEDPALTPFLPGIAERRGGPPAGAPEGWWAADAAPAALSAAPVWTDGAVRAEPVTLRLFLARTAEGWRVMPGGYARLGGAAGGAPAPDRGSVADIWVVGDEPVPVDTMAARPSDAYVRPLPGTLPSRAADNLFWLGRYVERAEAAIRLLRALHLRMAETGARDSPLLASLRDYLRELPLDPGEAVPQELLRTLDSALVCASRVHDRFSIDGWTALRNLNEAAEEMARTARAGDDTARIMTALLHRLAGLSGLVHENMYRFTGWRFLILGRELERASGMASALAHFADPGAPEGALDLAMEVGDCTMTYQRRYSLGAQRNMAVDLMVFDTMNPRSILFLLDRMRGLIALLPGAETHGVMSPLARAALRAHAAIAVETPETVDRAALTALERRLDGLSDLLSGAYLT